MSCWKMNKRVNIADSTFYIFFLSDIKKPEYLNLILKNHKFEMCNLVKQELKSHKELNSIDVECRDNEEIDYFSKIFVFLVFI